MKFEKTYKQYMEQFVVEGLLGSIAAAIPKTIGKAVGNVVKQAYADNPYVQAFGQVRQDQQGQRSEVRAKNAEVLQGVKDDLKNDPMFIRTEITFTDSSYVPLSSGRKYINNTKISYYDLVNDPKLGEKRMQTRGVDLDQLEGIEKLISEMDLNTLNLFDTETQNKIKEEIQKTSKEAEDKLKNTQGEDYKKRQAETEKVFIGVQQDLQKYLKPLGVGKSNTEKRDWLFILAYLGGKTSLHVKR